MCLRTCAKCADSDRPAHAQSIIKAFALHLYILQCSMILLADSEGPDQTARMRRLIWAFAVRICLKTCLRMTRPPHRYRMSRKTAIVRTLSMRPAKTRIS